MVLQEVEKGAQVRQMWQESPAHAGPEEKAMERPEYSDTVP